jgi:hypothetical protein
MDGEPADGLPPARLVPPLELPPPQSLLPPPELPPVATTAHGAADGAGNAVSAPAMPTEFSSAAAAEAAMPTAAYKPLGGRGR